MFKVRLINMLNHLHTPDNFYNSRKLRETIRILQ